MLKYFGNARQQYNFHLEDQKKKNSETKIYSQKAMLNTEIKEIQGQMKIFQKNNESLDTEFVKLLKQGENSILLLVVRFLHRFVAMVSF